MTTPRKTTDEWRDRLGVTAPTLQTAIERLLTYWRTHRIVDEEVNDCCELLAEAWERQKETTP